MKRLLQGWKKCKGGDNTTVWNYYIHDKVIEGESCEVKTLKGVVLKDININSSRDVVKFVTTEDVVYYMFHEQDCCECVTIDDVVGDIECLIGSPILLAEERTNEGGDIDNFESFTWTFYTFATIKGYVDIKWFGSSNGYYSESVEFVRAVSH